MMGKGKGKVSEACCCVVWFGVVCLLFVDRCALFIVHCSVLAMKWYSFMWQISGSV